MGQDTTLERKMLVGKVPKDSAFVIHKEAPMHHL